MRRGNRSSHAQLLAEAESAIEGGMSPPLQQTEVVLAKTLFRKLSIAITTHAPWIVLGLLGRGGPPAAKLAAEVLKIGIVL